jgi:hypothetical protein
MITQDFYGLNGFVWWVGLVEDINDPLKLGSIRVRIIGVHSEDKMLVPTEALPWAQVALPTTGAMTTSGPRAGDWVFGFFQDGSYAQIPVVMGIFPGIQSVQSQIVYNNFARTTTVPKPPADIVVRNTNEPTTARSSRGEQEGTHTTRSNKQLSHACDISASTRFRMGQLSQAFGTILKAIRAGIRALIQLFGSQPSPILAKIRDTLKKITTFVREIREFYEEEIKPWLDLIVETAKYIRALIDYIASLPERLAKLIRACLQEFFNAVSSELTKAISDTPFTDPNSPNPFAEIIEEANKFVEEADQAIDVAAEVIAFPAEVIESLVNPASGQDVTKAGTDLAAFTEQFVPSTDATKKNYTYTPADTA